MDILFEILIEVYMELMFLIIPEEKRKKKHRIVATLIAILLTVGIMSLGLVGIALLVEQGNSLGWLLVSIAVLLSLAQIICGILLHVRKKR